MIMEWLKSALIPGSREYMLTFIFLGMFSVIFGIIFPSGFLHVFVLIIFYICFALVSYPFLRAFFVFIKRKLK